MKPTVGSLFSGIGGFDLGLARAGWEVKWQVESNPFRQKILKQHWPDVELRSDIRTDTDGLERVDLICGGFPCQDLSVSGNRAGLAGERSGLFFQFTRILRTLRPRWCLIENVPGLLSSNQGRDFGIVVNTLADIGYGWSYRVLDSRFWGVAQRRRRVYIVGHLGGPCPPKILFEPESCGGDTAAGKEAGAEVASTLGGGTGNRGWSDDFERSGAFIPMQSGTLQGSQLSKQSSSPDGHGAFIPQRAFAVVGKGNEQNGTINTYVARPLVSGGNDRHDESQGTYIVNARQDPIVGKQPLDSNGYSLAIAYGPTNRQDGREWHKLERARTLTKKAGTNGGGTSGVVVSASPDADRVRKATGLSAGLGATPDGPRYAALGDAVTVPVVEWIGRRILKAHYGET